jgi:amino acid transporter
MVLPRESRLDLPPVKSEYRLGLYTLIGLVIANMIGSGVFTTSGFAMGDLGSPSLVVLAWFIGGCLALCGALSYGALARLLPVSGGEYLFLSRAIHPMIGFVAGWVSLLAGFTGAIAYAATAFEVYFLPAGLRAGIPENVLATIIIVIAAMAHGMRLRHGTVLQNISVLTKLILISVFFCYVFFGTSIQTWEGIASYKASEAREFSIFTFAMTLMWISFSYCGFNAAIYIASEVHDAKSVLPRAMFYGTLITMLIYILLNAIFVFAPAPELIAYKEDVAAIVAEVIGGEQLAGFIRIIISVALFTSVSAMIMIGPRVYAKMADDGLMPQILKFDGEVPAAAITMQATLAVIVVWISTLRGLLSYLGFTLGLSAVMTVASLFVIIKRQGQDPRHLPGYPWAPIIFILFTLLFAVFAAVRQPWQMAAAVITICSGIGVYLLIRRRG